MPARLPSYLPINDARRRKVELLDSLSEFDVEVIDFIASRNGRVFGGAGENIAMVKTSRATRRSIRMKEEDRDTIVLPRAAEVRRLERAGWLRSSGSPMGPESGYYHLTESAEKVWGALGRSVR